LKFTVENIREDLRKMLGTSLAQAVFKWEGLEPLNPADLPGTKIKVSPPRTKDTSLSPWSRRIGIGAQSKTWE
jgi:hypothetical protein